MEELSRDFLTGADLRQRAILWYVEVYGACFLCCRQEFLTLVYACHRDRACDRRIRAKRLSIGSTSFLLLDAVGTDEC